MRTISRILFLRLSLLTVFAFIIAMMASYFLAKRYLLDLTHKEASITNHLLGHSLEASYLRQLESLNRLVEINGTMINNNKDIFDLCKKFLSYDNIYNTLHYYAVDGSLLISVRRDSVPSYRTEKNMREKPEVNNLAEVATRDRKSVTSKIFYTSQGVPYQIHLVPHFYNGILKGFFSGGIYLAPEQMSYLVAGIPDDPRYIFLISDLDGRIVLRSKATTESDTAIFGVYFSLAKETLRGSAGRAINSSQILGRFPYAFSTEWLPSLGFAITFGISESIFFERRYELMKLVFFGLALCLVLAFSFTLVIGQQINTSLRRIHEGLEKILIGDFSLRISGERSDLFSDISKCVDQLAANLEKDKTLGEIWSGENELNEYLGRDK